MENAGPPRPRVSRETRLLLITVLISMVTLWVLARIRFPDEAATPGPVPPLLTQLANRAEFDDLAGAVGELESQLAPALLVLDGGPLTPDAIPALRIREDVAVALLAAPREGGVPRPRDLSVLARDPASGLAVIRVARGPVPILALWSPRRIQYPRYLVGSVVSRQGVSLRPLFVGSLFPVPSPTWVESIWSAPGAVELAPGAFVFTTDGALAGLAVQHDGRPALVPADVVLRAADRLLREGTPGGGWLGVEVQPLTPTVALASGATGGVVVTWIDPRGPAAGQLVVTDVIEMAGDEVVSAVEGWEARVARLAAGDPLVVRVRRGGEARDVQLTAGVTPPSASAPVLGLALRAVAGLGVEVVRVDPGSAAAQAGVEVGDVITQVDRIERPTPAQITRAFQAAPDDRPLLVGVTRGTRHLVLPLGKR